MSAAKKIELPAEVSAEATATGLKVVPLNKGDQGLPVAPITRDAHVGARYMPVYIEEEETSPVWLSGNATAIVAAGRLWRRSWRARPVGSLPSPKGDEEACEWIRKAAGVADKRTWEKIRSLVMHGYQRMCDPEDGTIRWYHLKQIAWATPMMERREQRNGKRGKAADDGLAQRTLLVIQEALKTGNEDIAIATIQEALAAAAKAKTVKDPGEIRTDPVSLQNGSAKNNGLEQNAASIEERREEKKEEPVPSGQTAGAVPEGAAQGSLLPQEPPPELGEVDRAKAERQAIWTEWCEIMDRIAPAQTDKARAILNASLIGHFGKGVEGATKAVDTLRDVRRKIAASKLPGYEMAKTDKARTKVVTDYLWAIIRKPCNQDGAAQQQRPKTKAEEARESYQRMRAKATGEPMPGERSGDGATVIDSTAEEV